MMTLNLANYTVINNELFDIENAKVQKINDEKY